MMMVMLMMVMFMVVLMTALATVVMVIVTHDYLLYFYVFGCKGTEEVMQLGCK